MKPHSFHTLRFNRAASHYEEAAGVQARMAVRLLALHPGGAAPSQIVEFGCGTGLLTRGLRARYPDAFILATDAAERMLESSRLSTQQNGSVPLHFSLQDGSGETPHSETLRKHRPFDLLASNALVQWFPDLAGHLGFAAKLAKPGSLYLLSGFSHSNFPELNALLREPPFSYQGFPGHNPGVIPTVGKENGWSVLKIEAWEEKEIHPSSLDVLRKIQTLGSARDPRKGGRLNQPSAVGVCACGRDHRFERSIATSERPAFR